MLEGNAQSTWVRPHLMRNVANAALVSSKADQRGARKICTRKVVSPVAGWRFLILGKDDVHCRSLRGSSPVLEGNETHR